MLVIALLGLVSAHGAPGSRLEACCAAADVEDCPSRLETTGPGVELLSTQDGMSIAGLWTITCNDGPAFLPDARRMLGTSPVHGQILTPADRRALACFEASCTLPPNLCITWKDDLYPAFTRCDGGPAGRATWAAAGEAVRVPLIVDGDVLVFRHAEAETPSATRHAAEHHAPARRPVRALPTAPPDPCAPRSDVYKSTLEQVNLGEQALRKRALDDAWGHYRAALLLDRCNAFAWSGLGDVLVAEEDWQGAATCHQRAVGLFPGHAWAWARLGTSHVAMGRTADGRRAFQRALELSPGLREATLGLENLDAAP
ncbi:MAG: tetratricopeptide repeat protein [Myxococcota bacterium]